MTSAHQEKLTITDKDELRRRHMFITLLSMTL